MLAVAMSAIPAYADLAVPMVLVVWPMSWVFLVFILPIEFGVGLRILPGTRINTLKTTLAANAVSTLLGTPLVLLLAMIVGAIIRQKWGVDTSFGGMDRWNGLTPLQQLIVVATQGPLLMSSDDKNAWTELPIVSVIILCIPSFFISVWCEYIVGRKFFQKEEWSALRRWAWIANVLSYAFIIIVLVIRLMLIIFSD